MLPVLLGLGLLIGGALIVANWEAITDWLKDFIPKLRMAWETIRDYVPHGARVVGDFIIESAERLVAIMHQLYYQEDGQWIEETTTRKVSESEVPENILNKVMLEQQQCDITSDIEEELQLEV